MNQNIAPLLGSFILALSFPVCLFGMLSPPLATKYRDSRWLKASFNSGLLLFYLISACALLLIGCFLTNNYAVSYVVNYSSSTPHPFYKITGLWAGLDGSILLWTWMVALFNAIVIWQHQNSMAVKPLLPVIQTVMHAILFFFLIMLVYADNPFTLLPQALAEGKGLNPLLQNVSMVIHPPCMYVGFTSASVPFAFAISALWTKRLDSQWIRQCRLWSITCWFFLTLGNLLGSQWAYVELGWGGFWAWDPVENAAIMPWFISSAFIHSVIVQEKRGMLKVWNMILVMMTFIMTIFGTFLTRSGVVVSVHSFSNSGVGDFFVVFMVVAGLLGGALLISRLKYLRPDREMTSWASKEGTFVLNNVLFCCCALAVCWGTMFPSISEYVTGKRVTVGPPFFNTVMAPLGLAILFLTGVGPLISWRKASFRSVKNNFLMPVILGLVATVLFFFLGVRHWYALATSGLATFVLASIYFEFFRGVKMLAIQKGHSFVSAISILLLSNKRKYGGYVVHIGIVLIFVGIAGAVYSEEKDFVVREGQSVTLQDYSFKFEKMEGNRTPHREEQAAVVTVTASHLPGPIVMKPGKHFYFASQQPSTEAAVYNDVLRDVYLNLGQYNPQTKEISLRVTLNPLVGFLWLGGILTLIGGLLVLIPKRLSDSILEEGTVAA